MITFACPKCGKTITLKDELAGRKGKCVQCGQAIIVPGEKTADSPSQVGDSKTLPPRPQPSFDRPDTLVSRSGADSGGSSTELHDFLAPAQAADELGRLGPYRVLKVLGAGGMGVVFEAEDPMLKRKVALKAMLPSLAVSESARKRFLREAQTAAGVEHDHIVHIYQVGEDRGVPFIAMQFLKGEPLDVRLQKAGKLSIAEVLRIGRETAKGLAAAHEHGLIHRDIKPANLWLETNGDRVKILDFGLARATADNASLTQSGAIIGTPAYMAPEQANSQPVDARCDLFSLGCVLYRLSTGEMPFAGKDTLSTLMAVAMQDPTPPVETNPSVPAGLSNLIMRLLAKDPKDRPASANAVADMLAELEKSPHAKIVSAPKSSGVKYTCPVCDAMVTMSQPLPEGKKVKCHKCEAMVVMKRPDEAKKTAVISPRDEFKVDTEKIVRPRVTKPSTRPARPRWLIWAIAASVIGVVGISIVVFTFRGRPPVKDGDGGGQAKIGAKLAKALMLNEGRGKEKSPDKPLLDPEDEKKIDDPPKPVVVEPPPIGPGKDAEQPKHSKAYTNRLGMQFVLVPKGKSWLGGGRGKPGHEEAQILHDFYLGKYEVMQGEWERVMGMNPSHFNAVLGVGKEDQQRFPVENVSWEDAQVFLERLNKQLNETGWIYRLPTALEWEYACRGGPMTDRTESAFDFYFNKPTNTLLAALANFEHAKALKRTCKVGNYEPNKLGLHDMFGNVSEWCADEVKSVGQSQRATRGGSWTDLAVLLATVNHRAALMPLTRASNVGLRVVRVPVPAAKVTSGNDREVAEWALDNGCKVIILTDPGDRQYYFEKRNEPAQDWKDGWSKPFRLFRIEIKNNKQLTDASLQKISGLAHLQFLLIEDSALTDASLIHLKGLSNLRLLQISRCAFGDAGFLQLPELPKLETLTLNNVELTGSGLRGLKNCPRLEALVIFGSSLTDIALEELAELAKNGSLKMPGITRLTLGGSAKISEVGIAHLKNLRMREAHDRFQQEVEQILKELKRNTHP